MLNGIASYEGIRVTEDADSRPILHCKLAEYCASSARCVALAHADPRGLEASTSRGKSTGVDEWRTTAQLLPKSSAAMIETK